MNNDKFQAEATAFISGLTWDQLTTLRGCIETRRQALVLERLRAGRMPWANDEEMQLCKGGKRIEAIKAYRARTWQPEKCDAETAKMLSEAGVSKRIMGYYSLMECKSAVDATWRVREVAGFVMDYLKETGATKDNAPTFFNILDAHSDSYESVNPRGFEYDELRDALDYLLSKKLIAEEVPEGDTTKTTDIWLL